MGENLGGGAWFTHGLRVDPGSLPYGCAVIVCCNDSHPTSGSVLGDPWASAFGWGPGLLQYTINFIKFKKSHYTS